MLKKRDAKFYCPKAGQSALPQAVGRVAQLTDRVSTELSTFFVDIRFNGVLPDIFAVAGFRSCLGLDNSAHAVIASPLTKGNSG